MNDRSSEPDRYVSFCNIDCDGMARRLLPLALRRLEMGGDLANPFWRRFAERAATAGDASGADALYLVCSHVMYLAEIFEDGGEAAELLEAIELQCC